MRFCVNCSNRLIFLLHTFHIKLIHGFMQILLVYNRINLNHM